MNRYNQTSLVQYAATIADAFGVERPNQASPAIDWVSAALADLCKDGYDRLFIHNPDSVGQWHYQKYTDMFAPVLKHTQITVPFQTVMPSVTPVCFATMYTGVLPEVHGIRKYEKPIVKTDSLFDALLRSDKKVALLSCEVASMSNIFKDRKIDIFNYKNEGERVDQTLNLIVNDQYDAIILYTHRYDSLDHKFGPEARESLQALRNQTEIFDQTVNAIKQNWTNHNTLIAFSPDHGNHACPDTPDEPGDHGSDSPLDINILHFLGAVCSRQAK